MKDSIDRQAAIDELRTCQTYLFDTHDKDLKISLEDAEYCIEQLPSAQPERKKGRWIKVNGKTAINCSACHHCSWSLSFEDTVRRFNFCPNCGADMRQKEGSDDNRLNNT